MSSRHIDTLEYALTGILMVPILLFFGLITAALVDRVIPLQAGMLLKAYLFLYQGLYLAGAAGVAFSLFRRNGAKGAAFWLSVAAIPGVFMHPPVQAMVSVITVVTNIPASALALIVVAVLAERVERSPLWWLLLLAAYPLLTWELFQFCALWAAPQALSSFWQQHVILEGIARFGGVFSYLLVLLLLLFIRFGVKSEKRSAAYVILVCYLAGVLVSAGILFTVFSRTTPRAYASYVIELVPKKNVSQLVVQFPLPLKNGKVPPAFLRRTRSIGKNRDEAQLAVVLTPYGRMGQVKIREIKEPLRIFWDDKAPLNWLAGASAVPIALQPRYAGDWFRSLGLESTAMPDYARVVGLPFFTASKGGSISVNFRFELEVQGTRGSSYRQIFCQYLPMQYQGSIDITSEGWQLLPVMEEVIVTE
ncbi:hypothetical protein MFMK1_000427 [Metallumcola ferriviriculae]|uniref:Uncharacterized protein n=1 Tax=Metallumcola ferriviriculae TaxID=3039180 RepID=A0AAU0UJ61_9FIRM|nr:hypothetical protein MFMK1_000427 [Desulfitibacteraceae bacterium MK1]